MGALWRWSASFTSASACSDPLLQSIVVRRRERRRSIRLGSIQSEPNAKAGGQLFNKKSHISFTSNHIISINSFSQSSASIRPLLAWTQRLCRYTAGRHVLVSPCGRLCAFLPLSRFQWRRGWTRAGCISAPTVVQREPISMILNPWSAATRRWRTATASAILCGHWPVWLVNRAGA